MSNNITLKKQQMEIRDYPVPLLTLESFTSKGMLIGSEACGVERGMIDVSITFYLTMFAHSLSKGLGKLVLAHFFCKRISC